MAARHMEGFKKYVSSGDMKVGLARIYTGIGSRDYTKVAGRYVNGAGLRLYAETGSASLTKAIDASGVTFFIHGLNVRYWGTGTAQELEYRRGTKTLLIGDSVTWFAVGLGDLGLSDGEWHNIEWIEYASGTDILYVDGVIVATNASSAFPTSVVVYHDSDGYDAGFDFSDWYILDDLGGVNNERIGPDARVETLTALSDDVTQNWAVVGAASAAAVLDNIPPDVGQYIAMNADDVVGQCTFTNLPTIQDVKGVQVTVIAANQDGGNLKNLAVVIGGTEVGSEWEPGLLADANVQIFDQTPAAADWSQASVNALICGVKSKA